MCVGRLLMWCPLPSTHTLTRAPLFDERAASSSRFFLPLLLRCQSRDTQDTKAPRHARERHPKSTNVVTTQARDDGSPFLLFCLGFRGSFPKFLGPFYPLIIKVRCLDITSLKNALCLLVCIASDTRGGRKEGTCAPAAAAASQ